MRQTVKFGKYLLLERIAVGGMAEVFVAKAFGVEGFERLLAIKKILPTMGEDAEFNTMFVDEARIAVQLSHANIVQVLDLGKHDDSLYIAMEYISGRDVRQLMERFRKRGRPLPVPQACTVVGKICEALDYAHRKRDAAGRPLGIVHRDVSPQNVLVSYEGDVKLIDFGIAKAESRLQRTQAGILKGKFSYMSPEQVRGQPIDHRSDVFAVGVLLWEMLCGEKLFTGDSDFAVLEKVRNGSVPSPRTIVPDLPEALEKVVMRALSADPNTRYQWASELHDALVRFTLIGDYVYGARQLSEWMREEFHAEFEKEQARLRGWLGVDDPELEVTPSDPIRRRPSAPGANAGPPGGGLAVDAPMAAKMPPSVGNTHSQRRPTPPQQPTRETDPLKTEPDDAVVQPPTPTGARHKQPAKKLATPVPGELRAPLLPEVAHLQNPSVTPPEDLSHDAPTRPMSMDDLASAERHLASLQKERAAEAQAPAPAAKLGDDDEHTLKDGAAFAKKMPPPPIATPAGGNPPPVGLGPDEATPANSPVVAKSGPLPIGKGTSIPTPGPMSPVSGKVPPPPVPTPAPLHPVPKAAPKAPPVASVSGKDPSQAKTDQEMAAIANEATRPMSIPQAFDVSDDPTAAPRAQRKQGLTRASRQAEPAPAPKGIPLWVKLLGAVAVLGVCVWLVIPAGDVPPGRVVFSVTPSVPAELLVDGKTSGPLTSFLRTLPAGPHKVEIRAGGYKPFVQDVTVAPGKTIEVDAALELEAGAQPDEQKPGGATDVVPREPSKAPWLHGGQKDKEAKEAKEKESAAKEAAAKEAAAKEAGAKEAGAKEPAAKEAAKDAAGKDAAKDAQAPAKEAKAEPAKDAKAPAAPDKAKDKTALTPPAAEAHKEPVKEVAAAKPSPPPQKTRLKVITDPPGARVLLDDKPIGTTPAVVEDLDPSVLHFVSLQLDGYKSEKRVVKFDEGNTREINVNLTALARPPADKPKEAAPATDGGAPGSGATTGGLVIMTRPVAHVRIDGADTGRWTPVPPSKPISLTPGTYNIELETTEGKRYEQKVTITAGATVKIIKMDL
ncbi:MAG: protein kinase [Deltaproteobacteria bacterium]|nr:protein kinase [Deltaproteobacteria bacterium]